MSTSRRRVPFPLLLLTAHSVDCRAATDARDRFAADGVGFGQGEITWCHTRHGLGKRNREVHADEIGRTGVDADDGSDCRIGSVHHNRAWGSEDGGNIADCVLGPRVKGVGAIGSDRIGGGSGTSPAGRASLRRRGGGGDQVTGHADSIRSREGVMGMLRLVDGVVTVKVFTVGAVVSTPTARGKRRIADTWPLRLSPKVKGYRDHRKRPYRWWERYHSKRPRQPQAPWRRW